MKCFVKNLLQGVLILFFLILGSIICFAESNELVISDNIIVIEGQAQISTVADIMTDIPLILLTKGEDRLEALYVSPDTYELKFKGGSGELINLYDRNGNKYRLSETGEIPITVIYDDVLGTIRYVINGKASFFIDNGQLKELVYIPTYNNFNQKNGYEKVEVFEDIISEVSVYNINTSTTTEILAFQINGWDNNIRILAGVDMPWYKNIGFELKTYINDIPKDVKDVQTNVIYKNLTANDKYVTATDYGYNYFSALVIKEIKLVEGNEYYIIIRPYTIVGENKYYGSPAKIDITKNGYEFDSNYKNQSIYENETSVSLSNGDKTFDGNGLVFDSQDTALEFSANFLNGEVYLDIAILETDINTDDCVFDVYVDDEFTSSIYLDIGRNNVFITEISEGSHIIKIVKKNNYNSRVFGFTYVHQDHIHNISKTSTWLFNDNIFTAWCESCQKNINMQADQNPIFLLTFESDISTEAASYNGFTLVNSKSFRIGKDIDGDNALHADTSSHYIDVEQSVLAVIPYYSVSFDLTITQKGDAGFDASLLTLISNFRNGSKVGEKTADYGYFLKYNTSNQTFATVKSLGNTSILNAQNSITMNVGTQYKITIVVDNIKHCAHVFVNDTYIGISEKSMVDMSSNETCYPSFKFNDGGNFYPIYDNFKIIAIK